MQVFGNDDQMGLSACWVAACVLGASDRRPTSYHLHPLDTEALSKHIVLQQRRSKVGIFYMG